MVIGVDIETSGTNLENGHRLIQIGFALHDGDGMVGFSEYVLPEEMVWSDEAEQVHKISRETLNADGKSSEIVDDLCYQWLISNGVNPDNKWENIATGFNVGTFDFPFIKHALPKTAELFAPRYAELNALCFALHGFENRDFKKWKKDAKKYAIECIGSNDAHDAGWDALMSWHCFQYFREAIHR